MSFLKKYWLEILVIAVIGGILLNNAAPSATWINTDSDGIHYTYAAEWLYPSHKGSAPLYLLLGRLFLFIPIGTEFWRMALISVISGAIASLFIMLIIRKKLAGRRNAKWYSIIGALVYGGSALAMSQNTIVEAYPLVTAVCLAIYYFCLKKKWLTSSILIGVAGAIHPTAMLIVIPMLIAYRELITWRRLGVMALFVLFYLYVPLTNRPPYMWFASNEIGGVLGFIKDSVDTAMMLTGKLAIYDFPKRILDTAGLILLNFAVIGVVPLFYAFKNGKWWYKDVLFWMIAIPAIYYMGDIAPQTYVYLQPTIAFGAIAIGIGLSKVNRKIVYATAVASIALLAFNTNYFDIGRTLDPNLSATKYYNVELAKVPDGQILMPYYGWEWAAIYRYNKENGREIIPVSIDNISGKIYQDSLTEQGIKFEDNFSEDRLTRQNYIAMSIVELNNDVWTTKVTDAETYGCEVVLAKDNIEIINKSPTEPVGSWHWKPTNPYSIITGSCEIKKWGFITMSNHNILYISLVIVVLYLLYTLAERLMSRKKISEQSKP
jgi:hypothetical protein